MTFSVWLTFLGASLLLSAAPGPDNLFVLAQSAVYGVRAGVTVVFGLMTGLVLQTFFAACGLAAVVAAVPALFMAIKLAGPPIFFILPGVHGPTRPIPSARSAPSSSRPCNSGAAASS